MREGALAGLEQRRSFCTVSGEVVLARPESLGAVVPVGRRLRPVRLVAVRRAGARPADAGAGRAGAACGLPGPGRGWAARSRPTEHEAC
ncbi:hypothetical protein ACFQ3Z_03770 [Streptomyces nogalater]